ncbi:MAG TPA: SCO family protein [Gemmatimonadales bacterium]|nr:SCO family protein [Gemmatimonadales bacterium]
MKLAIFVGLVALTACREGEATKGADPAQSASSASSALARSQLRGVTQEPPQPKPSLVLTTTEGKPFDLRKETKGMLTLVFFGYTNCPDVCPVHTANISKVLKSLPIEVSSKVRYIFITTDPERDTPEVLGKWLASFDAGFIGLTGTKEEILAAQQIAQVMPAVREVPDSAKPGQYFVGHAGQVIAFTPDDDLAHIVYPFGVRQMDWANDIPILVNGWPR